MSFYRRSVVVLAIGGLLVAPAEAAAPTCGTDPNTASDNLRFVQYFLSRPQDAAGCAMEVADGRIVVKAPVTNPAMSCPDMFSWKLFVEAIKAEFWRNWASDFETWPATPYKLCQAGQSVADCCNPDGINIPGYDNPTFKATYCPFFPGDHISQLPGGMPVRFGALLSKAHALGIAANPLFKEQLRQDAALLKQMRDAPEQTQGRQIRQSMAEIVFRNKPLFDYVFHNDLYNQDGIIQVFNANAKSIGGQAPYRPADGAQLTEIIFPADAVMIKSDWLNSKVATQIGLKEDPANPFIKMEITTPVNDNNGTILEPGVHWLLAIHVSSKDIPNWVWTTFEHVNNPGRCDYTGCNDSYGYASPDQLGPGDARNYTRPHMSCDNLPLPSYVLDLGGNYPGGDRQPGLAKALADLGIGAGGDSGDVPNPSNRAWLSYRLKGSQIDFTDATGNPSHLGNSVTEAGFVSTSSCMTCHARAGTTARGTLPPALGVFVNGLTDSGYLPSALGIPVPDWYNRSGQPPTLTVLQTDFVWGFLAANPLQTPAAAALRAQPGAPLPLSIRARTLGN